MDYSVVDIETDGLLPDLTKIHCMSVKKFVNGVPRNFTITDYPSMIHFLRGEKIIVGHNFKRYDIPALVKILKVTFSHLRIIDTLGLSWYLHPEMQKHGLETWGEILGVAKPAIIDWQNLTKAEYIHRCETDVEINTLLFHSQIQHLKEIYQADGIDRIMDYLSWKLECAAEQEAQRWKLDVDLCIKTLTELEAEKDKKIEALSQAMPPSVTYKICKKPKVMVKKDGTLSEVGKRWVELLTAHGLPVDYSEDLKVESGRELGNPSSVDQMKDWLYSLGWVPQTFKFVKDKKNPNAPVRQIPQLSKETELCPSVRALIPKEPALENLNNLFMIRHRIGILKGFLENRDSEDYLKAEVAGFTNTLRFMHSIIVNLPTVHRPYGKQIRGCLTVPDGHLLCGSDMSSLEDNTKQHYMYYFDPEYVREMRVPGFDPHLDIALQGEMMTQEEVDFYKWMEGKGDVSKVAKRYLDMTDEEKKKEHGRLNKIRKDAKVVNFSAIYGVGPPKMSQTTGWPLSKSKQLLVIYWKRNKAVKTISNSCSTRTIRGQMWLFNPVSKFWYSLRYEKDKFSTLNQGTGVYCFDTWVKYLRRRNVKLCGQFHDEICSWFREEGKDEVKGKLLESIKDTNEELKLNVELSISIDFGKNYAETH